MIKKLLSFFAITLIALDSTAMEKLIVNTDSRESISLNGTWHYIVDPYETGFYTYRYKERGEGDREAYWNRPVAKDKLDRLEHGYRDPYTIQVPGDWNSQSDTLTYYEGTIWYQRDFDLRELKRGERAFLYFGAVNYEAHVYLNGKKLGMHKGGFTPFNFEIPADVLKTKDNFLVVKVDNKRHPQEIPTVNTDWWNYGGITRDVKLLVTPDNFIQQYALQLDPAQDIRKAKKDSRFLVSGSVDLNREAGKGDVTIAVPELGFERRFPVSGSRLEFEFELEDLGLWSPGSPKLYQVKLDFNGETLTDSIGFRKIETAGKKILLNGEQVFLRGISVHEEIPQQVRRAFSTEDAEQLLTWAKELNANMVRLAHYPHNEQMTRMADAMGILVWSEIPVYWTIDFGSDEVLGKAKTQLEEMIVRDRNRASVIIWSVGNETPVSPLRTSFMKSLIDKARSLDDSRLISAALEVGYNEGVNRIDDPLGEFTDIVSVNEYLGWYGGLPDDCRTAKWEVAYDKPLFFSETGAGAKGGFYADEKTRWSEEFQEWFYKEQVAMFKRMPDNYSGLSPWILADFRSPRRNHPIYQQGWNRKGLIDDKGIKKKAFGVLREYYEEIESGAGKLD
ncbi:MULTISPECIES: glycoside hydrolase family 2 TIM barrel-domain containing protein [unclassified Microbulbifer]|uniref:glycoside hydrolase family 2 protein n=1 Tax=unclassified Microbulbifer TaxID=2619833 RepID=UPI0027E56E0E|nr:MULTISPECIES: glycoside hydrolase family 2 TIM barrel-domain containing protein [unclassified Microbulbifer]